MNGKRIRRGLLLPLLLVAAWSVVARAANMDFTSKDISLGAHVSGPTIGPDGLTGRVVVLEFWGINCPPCIASMPQLEALHRELGPQGLVMIGAHAQGGPAEEVRKTVTELGVTFTIVENATVSGGMDFTGIPHCMVFDHTGKCVYRGSPGDAHDVVMQAVKVAPGAILAGRTLTKLAPLGDMLKNESQWGVALKRARGMVGAKDQDTADEAQFVVERLEDHGREMLDRSKGLADSDPLAAADLAQRCSIAFKGSDMGVDAGKLLQAWKKDKAFQSAYRAGQQLAMLDKLRTMATRVPGGVPPEALQKAAGIARAIEQGWPGTDAATKAAAIVADMQRAAAKPPAE